MPKFLILSVAVLVLVIMGAGCNADKQTGENTNQNQNNFNSHRMSSGTPDNMRVMGTSTDLIVSKKVVVMGTTNSDGTITAQQIMIGDVSAMPFGTSTRKQLNFNSSTSGDDSGQITPPPSSDGQQWQPPADGQMPEQAQFRQRTGDGENMEGNKIRPARVAGQTSTVGEILKKDDTSLVIKLNDGGSKIVFYSATTKIFILTPPSAEKKD